MSGKSCIQLVVVSYSRSSLHVWHLICLVACYSSIISCKMFFVIAKLLHTIYLSGSPLVTVKGHCTPVSLTLIIFGFTCFPFSRWFIEACSIFRSNGTVTVDSSSWQHFWFNGQGDTISYSQPIMTGKADLSHSWQASYTSIHKHRSLLHWCLAF